MPIQEKSIEIESNIKFKNDYKKFAWFTYFSAATGNLLYISLGIFLSWPSSCLSQLKSNNTEINPLGTPVTPLQTSLLASTPIFTGFAVIIFLSPIINRIGRKKSLRYTSAILSVAYIVIALSGNINIYYVCLVIIGIGIACTFLSVPIYSSEIANDQNRNLLGCFVGISVPFGVLLGYIFGPLTSFRGLILISATPTILHIALSCLTVETPNYLIISNNEVKAKKSLRKLRNCKNIESEYKLIGESIQMNALIETKGILDIFKSRVSRRGIYLAAGQMVAQQLTGITFMLYFAVPILTEVMSEISGNTVAIIIGLIQCTLSLVGIYLIEKFGRRKLFLCSSCICAVSMFFLGLYYYLKHIKFQGILHIHWFPTFAVLLFNIGYCIGLGPLPVGMVPELFSIEFRMTGQSICYFTTMLTSYIVEFSFPVVSNAFGTYTSMFIHSTLEVIAFILVFLYLPETKGMSFAQIQNILSK